MATATTASQVVECPECGVEARGTETECVCPECGLVLDDSPIDQGPDWRDYESDDKNPSRAMPGNPNRDDKGMGSQIGVSGADADSYQFNRVRKLHGQMSRKDRGRAYATQEIDRLCGQLEVGDSVTDMAKKLFRDLHGRDWLNGRDMDTVAAACTYLALRTNQRGIRAADLVEYARDVDQQEMVKRYKQISAELGVPTPPPSTTTLIRRIASDMDLCPEREKWALSLYERVSGPAQSRGSPTTLAAACIYCAVGGFRGEYTQEAIADAADCTAASIRKRIQDVPGLDHKDE